MSMIYTCKTCKHETMERFPRCPVCGAWADEGGGTDVEEREDKIYTQAPVRPAESSDDVTVKRDDALVMRPSGLAEFDQAVGGGIGPGANLLLYGNPGIGKSTLLMTVAGKFAKAYGPVLYCSSMEMSKDQAIDMARRIGAAGPNFYILADDSMDGVMAEADRLKAVLVVIDSLQEMKTQRVKGAPGNAMTVDAVTEQVLEYSKIRGVPMLIAGHARKDGNFDGPMRIAHRYDIVAKLDDVTLPGFILLRLDKNRWGGKSCVGSFKMTPGGIVEVARPSAELLQGGGRGIITVCLEGTKPIAVEIQVGFTRRADLSEAIVGYPKDRLRLLSGVLDAYGIHVMLSLVLTVIGGYKIKDTSADIAVAIAATFASKELSAPKGWAAVGECDLQGRVFPPRGLAERVRELDLLGIDNVIVPFLGSDSLPEADHINIHRVNTLKQALRLLAVDEPTVSGKPDDDAASPTEPRKRGRGRPENPLVARAVLEAPVIPGAAKATLAGALAGGAPVAAQEATQEAAQSTTVVASTTAAPAAAPFAVAKVTATQSAAVDSPELVQPVVPAALPAPPAPVASVSPPVSIAALAPVSSPGPVAPVVPIALVAPIAPPVPPAPRALAPSAPIITADEEPALPEAPALEVEKVFDTSRLQTIEEVTREFDALAGIKEPATPRSSQFSDPTLKRIAKIEEEAGAVTPEAIRLALGVKIQKAHELFDRYQVSLTRMAEGAPDGRNAR